MTVNLHPSVEQKAKHLADFHECADFAENNTTLYRAVQSDELTEVRKTERYGLQQGMSEVKGFFASPEEASAFAQRFYTAMSGEGGPFTLTSAVFPNSAIPESINVAGEGAAYFLPESALSLATFVCVHSFFPLTS